MSRGRPLEPSQRIIERELQAYAAYAFTKGYPIACLPSIYPRTNHMFRYARTSCDLRKNVFPISYLSNINMEVRVKK